MSLDGVKFTPQDLENELREKLDFKVVVSCPKAHKERGRVERRIELIRQMLELTGEATTSPQSPLMWETTFARISNALNDLPIAKGGNTRVASDSFDVITPNRLLLGRNNMRGLSGDGIDIETSANLQKLLARSHEIFSIQVQEGWSLETGEGLICDQ